MKAIRNFKTDYQVGEIVNRKIMVDKWGHADWTSEEYPGKVIYIHPEKRYITLEFELPGGIVRESYNLPLTKQVTTMVGALTDYYLYY